MKFSFVFEEYCCINFMKWNKIEKIHKSFVWKRRVENSNQATVDVAYESHSVYQSFDRNFLRDHALLMQQLTKN